MDTFGVGGSISWEYVGVVQLGDVIQADAQAHIVDNLGSRHVRKLAFFVNRKGKGHRI